MYHVFAHEDFLAVVFIHEEDKYCKVLYYNVFHCCLFSSFMKTFFAVMFCQDKGSILKIDQDM